MCSKAKRNQDLVKMKKNYETFGVPEIVQNINESYMPEFVKEYAHFFMVLVIMKTYKLT